MKNNHDAERVCAVVPLPQGIPAILVWEKLVDEYKLELTNDVVKSIHRNCLSKILQGVTEKVGQVGSERGGWNIRAFRAVVTGAAARTAEGEFDGAGSAGIA
tara:strand:+ start:342 stop:647 length:306 start_codon:yes stop_codon:yes gene_type:complete